jgi:AcrR family transcriptional regulator
MADLNTKQKIIQAAIRQFNEFGMANVRLQQIAQDVGISPGNLAYHFRNKEAVVEAVIDELYNEDKEILAAYRLFPNLIDFDNQLSKYFSFIEKYPFYFLDFLEIERYYPEIQQKRLVHITKMISQIRKRFDFNQQRGVLTQEPKPGMYDDIAQTIWVLITFWLPQNLVRGKSNNPDSTYFKEMVWNQLYPYFTPEGKAEFEQLIVPILKKQF